MYMLQWLFTTGKLMEITIKGASVLRKGTLFLGPETRIYPFIQGTLWQSKRDCLQRGLIF